MRKLKNEELGRKTKAEAQKAEKIPLIIVLDNVRSGLNIGSVFRTADAFQAEAIYLCGISAQPPDKEIHKTALGATETVPWKYYKETVLAIEDLKKNGWTVYAIEQVENSLNLYTFAPSPRDRIAVVFGHEVKGVEQSVIDLCHGCIEIPQEGMKHSLNIAVSAGIVMWDLWVKMKKT